ncbi:MAG: hypothetical protein V1659_00705 [Candidatus Woesearchaeota archaeon]
MIERTGLAWKAAITAAIAEAAEYAAFKELELKELGQTEPEEQKILLMSNKTTKLAKKRGL